MRKLPNSEFRQTVALLREKRFYECKEPRRISWPEYNLSQIEDTAETLEFIREFVDAAPDTTFAGKPLTDPKVLAKAVLAYEALGFTERSAQDGFVS